MHRVEVNVQTGEQRIIELTPDDLDQQQQHDISANTDAPEPLDQ